MYICISKMLSSTLQGLGIDAHSDPDHFNLIRDVPESFFHEEHKVYTNKMIMIQSFFMSMHFFKRLWS